MNQLEVVDGRIAHGYGSLPLVLQGEERGRAHHALMKATDPSALASDRSAPLSVKRTRNDFEVAALLKRDPSLLLEPIPRAFPGVSAGPSGAWDEADAVWNGLANSRGTWLARLSEPSVQFVESIRVGLDAGIHPDDERVWPEKSLLARDGWCLERNRVDIALDHGASPTRGEGWGQSYLRTVLLEVASLAHQGLEDGMSRWRFGAVMTSAETLIAAGTTELDIEDGRPGQGWRRPAATLSSIGMLMDTHARNQNGTEATERLYGLMDKLHSAGVDIDRPTGAWMTPPVVLALRCGNIGAACHLVAMGCKTADDDIVSAKHSVRSLTDEAFSYGKDDFRTRIVAAVMQRQLAVASAAGAVAPESAARAPRRRMAV